MKQDGILIKPLCYENRNGETVVITEGDIQMLAEQRVHQDHDYLLLCEAGKPELVKEPQRMSKCAYRHDRTKVENGVTYGGGSNGRQQLWGNYPIVAPSSKELPFFRSKPDKEFDDHYCGCCGWD